jgi:ArsR family transcriptional regulator, arsenate/arsenite/antimonite-responsive transcriptional repressor
MRTVSAPKIAKSGGVAATFRACLPIFQALGDANRQSIVLLLAKHEALNVNHIAERVALARPTISHHLKMLRLAGIVKLQRHGTENHYSLEIDDALRLLGQLIKQVEVSCA